jgi:hypothetical protein
LRTAIPTPSSTPSPHDVSPTTWRIDVATGSVTELDDFGQGMTCETLNDGAKIEGKVYAGIKCGPISPDERWMTYQVDAGTHVFPSGYEVPVWDQWVVNLETDERRLLQQGLIHCGGCDGRFGAAWSASSRYVYFPELVQTGRTFLSDVESGTTRLLFEGSTNLGDQPQWSPVEDVLLYKAADGTTVLEDLAAGTMRELRVATWPARFDSTGTLAFTWGFDPREASAGGQTTMIDLGTSKVIGIVAGLAAYPFFGSDNVYKVARSPESFVAALSSPPGCTGFGLYRNTADLECVAAGRGASVAPDATKVAYARVTGSTRVRIWGLVQEMYVYEIVVRDVQVGGEVVVGMDAISSEVAPSIEWDLESRELLVRWPIPLGP